MSDGEWVSVAEYETEITALVASKLLTSLGIRSRIYHYGRGGGTWATTYLWVPPADVEAAKEALKQPVISEAELTELALKAQPEDL